MSDERAAEPTFEEAVRRLGEIATRLEDPDVELDESFALYEEAIELLRAADRLLRGAEGRLVELVEAATGVLEVPREVEE